MAESIRIIGVYPIPANEPCHLVEIELAIPSDDFDFGLVTQEIPNQPKDNWQVAYDEQPVAGDEVGSRWLFFFHYLNCERPLLTPLGPIALPEPNALPDYLKEIEYYEP